MKRTRIRPVSRKRAAQDRLYSKLRKVFLDRHPICQVCSSARATEVHHKAGRGALYLDIELWLAACHDCHQRITEHPAWAIEQGWSLPRIGVAS